MSMLSSFLRPFDGVPSVSFSERAEIRRVLRPLACVAAEAALGARRSALGETGQEQRPVPSSLSEPSAERRAPSAVSVEWLSRQSGVPPPRVLRALVVLEQLGMAVQGPEGWAMSPETHEACSLAAWDGRP